MPLPTSPIEKSVKKEQSIVKKETLLKGKELSQWCRHMYRTMNIGFNYVDSRQEAMNRILSPHKKSLVFLDLDETLTATNESPSEGIKGSRSDSDLNRYMDSRVPAPLRARIRLFLLNLTNRNDVDWFILTDNIFPTTRCTLKLAFDIDTEPGTIIDREMRSSIGVDGKFVTKADFIGMVIQKRRKMGLPTGKIVFADNMFEHREDAEKVVKSENANAFICCDNLKSGLTEEDISKIYRFINN